MIATFLGGCLAGFAIAVPVGAVASVIIVTAASRGWRMGAAAGLGAATADGIYATVAALVGAVIAPYVASVATPLRWGSAVVLVAMGAWMIRGAHRIPASSAASSAATPSGGLRRPAQAYVTLLGVTIVNPATVVYFAALIVGSPVGRGDDPVAWMPFVLGAFLASASWQLLLAGGGSMLGRVLTGPTGRQRTAVIGGAVVILLAVKTFLGW